jgi:hypothetical protein
VPVHRRNFIRQLGIPLGSMLLARCRRAPAPNPVLARGLLRICWMRFDEFVQAMRDAVERGDGSRENGALGQMMNADHRRALGEPAAGGEIAATVADLVREGFSADVSHLWRSNVRITCCEPMIPDYGPAGASNLVRQSEILTRLADEGGVPPATLAMARASREHDPRQEPAGTGSGFPCPHRCGSAGFV